MVDQIVDEIAASDLVMKPGSWPNLNLAFIDPEGLETRWETVEKLAGLARMDLVIHYPEGGLNRNMKKASASEDSAINSFFGTDEWRGIFEKFGRMERTKAAHRELIDLYKGRLESMGYEDVTDREPLVRNVATDAPLYRLIFASKHPRGHDFWDKISRTDPGGQTSFDWD